MEQMFRKNWIERFGDFYSKAGRRALLWLGGVLIGLLEIFTTNTGAGSVVFIFSVCNLLSVIEKEKTKYIGTVQVSLPDGKVTECALFEKRAYAHAPLFMAIFSLNFYIPYRKQYILVRNMGIRNIAPRKRVSSVFLNCGLLDIEVMPKSKYRAVMKNPQIISEEMYARIAPRREAFLQETKSFFETGLMEELYCTDYLSVCKLYDEQSFVLFHYESHSGVQWGLNLNKDYVEKIKEDDSFLLESYTQMNQPDILYFNTEGFERLLKIRNSQGENAEKASGENFDSENLAKARKEAEKKYIEIANESKKVFTRSMITAQLKSRKSARKLTVGIILLYLSAAGIVFTIIGIMTGAYGIAAGGFLEWLLLTYFGVKNIRISNKNRRYIESGQYRILAATCVAREVKELRDAEGDPSGYAYVHRFSDGGLLESKNILAVEGDTVYLVYLKDSDDICAHYNAVEYKPADDLVIG